MLLTTLLEPFQFSFMVNAMLVAAIVAIPCALLSVFLVLKGWALMGDAMSHAVFPGVVLAYIIGIPFAIKDLQLARIAPTVQLLRQLISHYCLTPASLPAARR